MPGCRRDADRSANQHPDDHADADTDRDDDEYAHGDRDLDADRESDTVAFTFHLTQFLRPGELLYARDDCFDPELIGIGQGPAWGPAQMVSPAVALLLSRLALGGLIGRLTFIGLASLRRLRRSE